MNVLMKIPNWEQVKLIELELKPAKVATPTPTANRKRRKARK